MKPDFNLSDSFSLFDINRTGSVSIKDLHEGLIAIGVKVQPSMSDLHLLAARYSRNVELGLFSKDDFKRLLLPNHEHYSEVLKKRRSNKRDATFSRHDCFNFET